MRYIPLDYSLPLQTLILKLPSWPHEEAAGRFEAIITCLAAQLKVTRRISYLGATRIDGPTVALEVGYSEQSTAKLGKDITWWLRESKGWTIMGITIDIKRGSGNIEIKSWVCQMQLPYDV